MPIASFEAVTLSGRPQVARELVAAKNFVARLCWVAAAMYRGDDHYSAGSGHHSKKPDERGEASRDLYNAPIGNFRSSQTKFARTIRPQAARSTPIFPRDAASP
jgi:hypothetical protein